MTPSVIKTKAPAPSGPAQPFRMHRSRLSLTDSKSLIPQHHQHRRSSSKSSTRTAPVPLTPFPFGINNVEAEEDDADDEQQIGGELVEEKVNDKISGKAAAAKINVQSSKLNTQCQQGHGQGQDPAPHSKEAEREGSSSASTTVPSAVSEAVTSTGSTSCTRNPDDNNVSATSNQSVSFDTTTPLSRVPKSFSQRRHKAQQHSTPEIPRPSILKVPLPGKPPKSPIVVSRNIMETLANDDTSVSKRPNSSSSAFPIDSNMQSDSNNNIGGTGLSAATYAASLETPRPTSNSILQSPCFYHQRFDQVVDFDKVLAEIDLDDNMSHSRLMQTASSVREVSRQLQRRPIRAKLRNVMIVTKARDNSLVYKTRELAEWLMKTPRYGSKYGVNVYVDKKLMHSKRFNAPSLVKSEPAFADMLRYWTPDLCWTSPEKFDLVLTLGGDGTVLFTSMLFQRVVPPILSFSLGSLGFLTNFNFENAQEHLHKILSDGMRVNMRMRFTCTVYRDQPNGEAMEAEQFEVLNELVIDRGPSPYVSSMELYGDDTLITVIQADGCIFSTPTGSTAYSLSAGGSLVHPDIPATLITPICPHTLSFRPMILSDSVLFRINIPKSSRATAYAAFDGRARLELRQGDYITLAASQFPFPTVVSQPHEWIDSIQRTLKWNTRAAAQKAFTTEEDGDHDIDGAADVWDIDTDSGVYSDDGNSSSASPIKRSNSLLLGG